MEDSFITAKSVQAEFNKGKLFKQSLNLFEQVKKNERFYLGNQWEGLNTSKIQPVTFNILRRVTSLFQSQVVSDDISWNIVPFDCDERLDIEGQALDAVVERVFERQCIKTKNRKVLRNGVVDGDLCMYFTFDTSIETGQMIKGDIVAQPIMNTNVFFGNPYTQDVQNQPYIIIARRRHLSEIRKEAKQNGIKNWHDIKSCDFDDFGFEDCNDDNLVTELTRMWKVKVNVQKDVFSIPYTVDKVCFMKVCGNVITFPKTQTGMTLYPVAWASWIERNNCMHGISPISEMIPTQIAINKQATYIGAYTQNIAMPKLVYNAQRLPNGWNSDPSRAIGVVGDPREVIANPIGGVNMPSGVFSTLEIYQSMMKDCMGASDTALGNISNPDNTSAILATQKASNAPLELQKRMFEQFNEDCIRIIVDMACAYYGLRTVNVNLKKTLADGSQIEERENVVVDFDNLSIGAMDINVDVGAASYWSEIVAMSNMDKLMQSGMIVDPVLYLKSIPKSYIPNKQEIIDAMQKQHNDVKDFGGKEVLQK